MKPALVILLHSHARDRVYQAASLCLAASSMGWACHLVLFYQALAEYVGGAWDADPGEMNAPEAGGDRRRLDGWSRSAEHGFDDAGFPPIAELLEKARGEEGGLKLYACSASVRVLGLDPEVVRRRVDEIVGLPTVLGIAESARFAWYI